MSEREAAYTAGEPCQHNRVVMICADCGAWVGPVETHEDYPPLVPDPTPEWQAKAYNHWQRDLKRMSRATSAWLRRTNEGR